MKALLLAASLTGFALVIHADSNIVPEHSFSWAGNIGWMNWRANPINGVDVTASYCAGFIYSPNVGWINLGNGPANGVSYSNQPGDYGVNISASGELRGSAYGANIGWVLFENFGSPQVDIVTGKMRGHAYSANTGWISLADGTNYIQSTISPETVDTDGDGIADSWEIRFAGGLDRFDGSSDSDGDGVTDLEEYRRGTDPLNPADPLEIVSILAHPQSTSVTIIWRSVPLRRYRIESLQSLSGDSWKQLSSQQGSTGASTTSATVAITSDTEFFRVLAEQ